MLAELKLLIGAGLNSTQAGIIACTPIGNIRMIARELGLKYPAVRASVQDLERAGWLVYDKGSSLRVQPTARAQALKQSFDRIKHV